MRICVVQSHPVIGDVAKNKAAHLKLAKLAIAEGAQLIVFPELSLTGYEPQMADKLAMRLEDTCLSCFQGLADSKEVTLCVGLPIRNEGNVHIGLAIFSPRLPRRVYFKQYLHTDELPYFVPAVGDTLFVGAQNNVALAICYEISVSAHLQKAIEGDACFYVASVAKFRQNMPTTFKKMSDIANKSSLFVFMSNCVGKADDGVCAGSSAVWNDQGQLMACLDDKNEGFVLFDTTTKSVKKLQLN